MKKSTPKVSIIIPIYNGEKYLEECLSSVVGQTLKEVEIICIDDRSTDKSLDILNGFAEKSKRVRVIRNERNSGAGESRNRGIREAQGEYVFFLDSDDTIYAPDSLEKLYHGANKSEADITVGSFVEYDERTKTETSSWESGSRLAGYEIKKDGVINYSEWQQDFGFQRCLFRRDFLIKNSLAFPNLSYYEDPVFFVKACVAAKKIYGVNKKIYRYRRFHKDPEELTLKQYDDMIEGISRNLAVAAENNFEKLEKWCEESLKWSVYVAPEYRRMKDENERLTAELDDKNDEIDRIKSSGAFRLGLFLTKPLRILRKFLK